MNCERADIISLLIDGELGPEETRAAEAHVEACAACRRTHADFLALREAVASYPVNADARATSAALEKVLAAGGVRARDGAGPKPAPSWRDALRLPRLTPAWASAVAAVLLAVVAAAVWSMNRQGDAPKSPTQVAERVETPQPDGAVPTKDAPVAVAGPEPTRETIAENSSAGGGKRESAVAGARRGGPERRRVRQSIPPTGAPEGETVGVRPAPGRAGDEALADYHSLFVAASGAAVYRPRPLPEAVAGAERETTRHLEQAQRMLRTIRNARPGEQSVIVADERRRSQRLLYRNIVLRREAARAGNASVERALDSLEPILIDIANLPERPAREEVGVIQERMRRKDIVAVLQANIAAVQ